MKRKDTWPEALHDFIESRKATPFTWGVNDCCLFVADAIEAMTGDDPASEFRGRYADEAGALEAIKTVCGGENTADAITYVAKQNEWEPLQTVLLAQRGDLVTIDTGVGIAAGVVHLNGREALFVSTDGLHKISLRKCKQAWRVK